MNIIPGEILIVDDDDRNIFALKAVLTSKQYSCVTASSGRLALDLLKENPAINVALIDMMMPEMDGYELIGRLTGMPEYKNLLIVAVTAQAMPGDKEKCIRAGAHAYISKPVDIDKLLETIHDGLAAK